MKNLFLFVGLRHIQQKPLRTLLTFLGVSFGVALYVAIAMINQSTRKTFRENIESVSGKSKFVISAGRAGFAEAKLETVRTTAGVKFAVPMVENRAYLAGSRDTKESLYILGVDLLQESSVRSYAMASKDGGEKRVIDDPLVFLNQPDSLIVTETFAQRNGLKIESKIKLATANGDRWFTVRGLLDPEGAAKAYGGNLAIMDIDGARFMFGKIDKIDRIDIVPVTGAEISAVRENLLRTLGPGFTVEEPSSLGDSMENMVKSYQLILAFFSSLALLVGLFLIYNSTSVSIAERRREIGVLRALGASRNGILILFVLEATVIGLVGSAFGCFLGRYLSLYLVDQVSEALSNQYGVPVTVSRLVLERSQIFFTLALGGFTSAFAALIPAYRASKVAPTEAMRSHGMETFRADRASTLVGWGGFAIFLTSLLMMYVNLSQYWKPFDQVGQGASVIGAAFFGPVLVFWLIRGFRFLIRRSRRSTVLKLAQENLLRARARTSANIMSLMVGLYFVMLIATVRASFHHTVLGWSSDVLSADFIVSGSGRFITAETQPMDPKIAEEILLVPGIRPPGEGRGIASRIARISYEGVEVVVKAFDKPSLASKNRSIAVIGQDRNAAVEQLFRAQEPSMIISDNFLLKHPKTKIGELLRVNTPTGAVDFRVIAFAKDYASPEGVFYIPRFQYAKFWQDHLVSGFAIYLKDPSQAEKVRIDLDRMVLSKHGLVSISNREMRHQMEDVMDKSFAYTKAVEFAALLVALLGLLNTLLISVLERTREIGMLRAIGSTRQQIGRLILLESLIQGGFGAVIATLLGGTVGYFFVTYALGVSMGWLIEFFLPVKSVFLTIATGVIVALFAGVIPARRAARLKIVDALDAES